MDLFSLLPLWYQYGVLFLFGLIIGSFLNVVIYRYHTGKSLSGSSHCMSCGYTLRWYELFPLVSYLCLFGRCSSCRCKIPARYFLVEFSTACLFLIMYMQLPMLLVPISLLLGCVLMVVTVYDIYHMVIPNQLVLLTSVGAVGYYGLTYWGVWSLETLLWHTIAAVGAFLFYGSLWFVSKGRWIGFGDAKLAAPLGFMLGTTGAFSFVVLSFWVGALLSISIMYTPRVVHYINSLFTRISIRSKSGDYAGTAVVLSSKSFTMKSEVPFAPFMIIAFLLVYLYQVDVLQLISQFI